MKLSVYAKQVGVSYLTAWRWFHNGEIDGAYQTKSGTVIVPDTIFDDGTVSDERYKTVVYARVSSNEQRKTNLETQAKRVEMFCIANGWSIDQVVKDVGSGLNDNRKKLSSVLTDSALKRVVVEHRDRLTRFGFHYLELLAETNGFEIVVVNKTLDNDKDDILADFTAIITSFCARLYSRRRGKQKSDTIQTILTQDDETGITDVID